MRERTLFPSRLSWTAGCGRIPWLCSLSITYSAGAPVEHLGLLACVNQKACSGEGKVESWSSYLSPTQLPKKTERGEIDGKRWRWVYTVDRVCVWGLCALALLSGGTGERPLWPRPALAPPAPHLYILFIKGTFYRISPPSLCPSPAAIHFNPALVKASLVSESRAVGAEHLI